MCNPLKDWLGQVTNEQKLKVLAIAGITPGAFHQMQGAYRTDGVVSLTPEKARALELATAQVHGVPRLYRWQLCQSCAKCEHCPK